MYNRRVLADLNHAADVYSAIIEKYGKFESFDKSGGVHIPSDMMEEIMDNRGLLAGKCFEVAGTDCKVLLHLHQLQSDQCLLHPNPLSQLMEYSEPQWNSTAAVNLRATTFVLGDLNFTLPDSRILPGLESTSGTRQMVVCRNINNQYSLILSTDLERVGQAADVISAQMPIIAAVLLIVSIAAVSYTHLRLLPGRCPCSPLRKSRCLFGSPPACSPGGPHSCGQWPGSRLWSRCR